MTRASPKKPRDPCNLPIWQKHVHLFDGLEISPCVTDGASITVTEDPDEAEFWSVYGHYNPELCDGFGGVDCLEDFTTEPQARAFARKLIKRYPHLAPEADAKPRTRKRPNAPKKRCYLVALISWSTHHIWVDAGSHADAMSIARQLWSKDQTRFRYTDGGIDGTSVLDSREVQS
jgi:hypothetical protein